MSTASKPVGTTDQAPVESRGPLPAQYGIAPTPSFPGPPLDPRLLNQPQALSAPQTGHGLKAARAAAEYSLREFILLQKKRRYDDPVAENRLLSSRDIVLADLKTLRSDVSALVKAGESHRWGRWVLGGFL